MTAEYRPLYEARDLPGGIAREIPAWSAGIDEGAVATIGAFVLVAVGAAIAIRSATRGAAMPHWRTIMARHIIAAGVFILLMLTTGIATTGHTSTLLRVSNPLEAAGLYAISYFCVNVITFGLSLTKKH